MPSHARAHAGLSLVARPVRAHGVADVEADDDFDSAGIDIALARAASLVAEDDRAGAANLVQAALAPAPPGNAEWTVPIEPLLAVENDRAAWAGVLRLLGRRAM